METWDEPKTNIGTEINPAKSPARQSKFRSLWFAPIILLGAFFFVSLTVLWLIQTNTYATMQNQLVDNAESTAESIRLRLKGNQDYVLLLAKERSDRVLNAQSFQEKASRYVADHPELINIAWVDEDFVIYDTAPLAPNKQILGLRIELPEPKRAAHLAMEQRQPVYTQPFEAIQGEPSFELWVPVFHGEDFLGLFAVVYPCEKVMQELIPAQRLENNQVSLVDVSGKVLWELPATRTVDAKLTHRVPLTLSENGVLLQFKGYGAGILEQSLLLLELLCLAFVIGIVYTMWRLKREIEASRQAEEALRESERMQRLALHAGKIGAFEVDLDRGQGTWTPELAEIWGMPNNFTGNFAAYCWEHVHPQDLAQTKQDFARITQSGKESEMEFRIVRPDGAIRWLRWRGQVIQDSARGFARAVGVNLDITERKQHEIERDAIITISNALRTAPARAEMLPILLDQLNDLFHADGATLAMRDSASGDIVIELGRGVVGTRFTSLRLSPGEGVSGLVIATGKPYLNNAVETDARFAFPDLLGEAHAVACAPLIAQEQTIGALWIVRRTDITENELRLLNAIADIAANAVNRVTLHEQTERRLRRLAALHEIDMTISADHDLNRSLSILLNQVVTQLGVDAADVLLFDSAAQILEYGAGCGFRTRSIEYSQVRLGIGQTGRAALEHRVLALPDLTHDSAGFHRATLLAEEGFVSHFVAPLIAKGELKGVLEVFHRTRLDPEPEWLDFLKTLATQAAIAFDNANLFDHLQRSNTELIAAYDATIEGWSRALDLRDKETEGHTQRVTEMSVSLAKVLGLREAELIHVRRGALLHDIGKMAIPDRILFKPDVLTAEEWLIMRKHPEYAYDLITPISYLRPAVDIPYCHHEKWDGSGYPRGLKGDQIPLAARIFAVVDVWDALVSDRPYRPAWTAERAFAHLREQAGKHFDPMAVEAFLMTE